MEKIAHDLGFKRSSYGIFTFVDFCWYATFDRIYFSINQALQKLNSNFLQLLDSKLNLNQTLSKSKPRLNVLIMVCQRIQTEVLVH